MSSRELSLLEKTWNGKENSRSGAQENLCPASLYHHAAAGCGKVLPPNGEEFGAGQREKWGNGLNGP